MFSFLYKDFKIVIYLITLTVISAREGDKLCMNFTSQWHLSAMLIKYTFLSRVEY